jgi:hypothetical protein
VIQWPFAEVGFIVAKTPNKVATHLHLKELRPVNFTALTTAYAVAIEAMASCDYKSFLLAVTSYREGLRGLGLEMEETTQLLSKINEHSAIFASKGCGAMGADTIALFFMTEDRAQVTEMLDKLSLPIVASDLELDQGLRVELASHEKEEMDAGGDLGA